MPFIQTRHFQLISTLLGLTHDQMYERCKEWQLSDPYRKEWTPEEEKVVFELSARKLSLNELSKILHRHYLKVQEKLREKDLVFQKQKIQTRLSKNSALLRGYIKKHCGAFQLKEDYRFAGSNYAYRLDYYIPQFRLAFEYDGEQHDKFIEAWHGDAKGLAEGQRRDRQKDKLCAKMGITLIRFSWQESLTEKLFKQKLDDVLKEKYARK